MGKVPFISPSRLFGTGAIKVRRCYLSLQKGLAVRRDEGKTGEERGKEEKRPVEIGRIGRSNCLSFLFPCRSLFFPVHLEPSSLWLFLFPIFSLADTCCGALLDSARCEETHTLLTWHAYNYIANSKSSTLSRRAFPPKVSKCVLQRDKAQIAVGFHVG